jgi:hypothetical protein
MTDILLEVRPLPLLCDEIGLPSLIYNVSIERMGLVKMPWGKPGPNGDV